MLIVEVCYLHCANLQVITKIKVADSSAPMQIWLKNHGLSEKLVRATIDTLYVNGIVEVWSVGKSKGKHSNYYRLNYEKFKEYEKYSMDELKNPSLKIETVKGYNLKGYSPSYLKNDSQDIPKESPIVSQELPIDFPSIPQSTNNIDIIENIDNINNKENIDNNIEINDDSDIEETCNLKISKLLDEHYSETNIEHTIKKVASILASSDWVCYKHFKNYLKTNENTKGAYKLFREYFRELNELYEP